MGVPTPPVGITVARCRRNLESGTLTRPFISRCGRSYLEYLKPRDLPLERGTTIHPARSSHA